ncbi:MAG: hypothetical protein RL757_246 [Bacteroidota bacterium]|jgi:hypothetical protein
MRILSALFVFSVLTACQNPQNSTTNQSNSTNTASSTPPAVVVAPASDSAKIATEKPAPTPIKPAVNEPKPAVAARSLAAPTIKSDTTKPVVKKPKHMLEGNYVFSGFDSGMSAGYLIDNLSMKIEGDRVSGSAGCNNYFGSCTVGKNKSVTFSKIGETKKMCSEELMQTEEHLVKQLGKATRYTIEADRVSFWAGEEPLCTFKKTR